MQSSLGNSSQKDLASEIKMLLKWLVLPDFDSFHKINILIFTQNKQCLQSNEKRDFFFFSYESDYRCENTQGFCHTEGIQVR